MENVEPLLDEVEVLEGAIACELNAQDVAAFRIAAEIQVHIDISEKELARNYAAITSKHAEREKRVAVVHEEGRGRLEELRRKLADAKHALATIQSPILILPYEITTEIFNWHMSMGGHLKTVLIAVTDGRPEEALLQGAVICDTIDYLRLVLSRAQPSPLQVELSLSGYLTLDFVKDSPQSSSLRYGLRADANRHEAISLILNDQILTRCTYLTLNYTGSPRVVENMTILPLLSSLYIGASMRASEIATIRSLIKFSPSLRHIRWHSAYPHFEDLDIHLLTRRIESYGWLYPRESCHVFHESSSLRELGIHDSPAAALTLPALQVLRWSLSTYSALRRITAPHLHTLILSHQRVFKERLSASSITLPNLRVGIHSEIWDILTIRGFQTPVLEHLSIEAVNQAPTDLFELFDGSVHMPTPKSLHLECAFTDTALIAVLGRLPWLEELQVAGTIAQAAFWKGLIPSSEPTWRVWLPKSHPDEPANRILLPNLKVLLINYSTADTYTPPISQSTNWMTGKQRAEIADYYTRGGEWTVMHASAVAFAREQAGCPLETLVCWSPEMKVAVLIGSLDALPRRPKWDWNW